MRQSGRQTPGLGRLAVSCRLFASLVNIMAFKHVMFVLALSISAYSASSASFLPFEAIPKGEDWIPKCQYAYPMPKVRFK